MQIFKRKAQKKRELKRHKTYKYEIMKSMNI